MKGRKLKIRNRLWIARKRAGLGQKQLARLLNHKTPDQVSRYERGKRVPTLQIALELEIALQTPLRVLFNDLYEQLRSDLVEKIKSSPQLSALYDEALHNNEIGEYCTYADLLDKPHPSEAERTKARAHVTRLARKIAYL
jgi:transcriptional regulator with XRE-family HTH domain